MIKRSFEELEGADLIVDCIYEAGAKTNWGGEPLIKLFPKLGTAGGIRKYRRDDNHDKQAYIVLYSDMSQLEWPDYLDVETGIFRYYGDNRKPGRELTDVQGNQILEEVFNILNSGESLEDIPPIFIFKNGGGRDKQFLGLAAPGNPNITSENDLVAFWRTTNGKRFQNYVAYFTILDTGDEPISHEWLVSLIEDHDNNLKYAPNAWKEFIKNGREGIKALKSPIINTIPNKQEQLECNGDNEGKKCLDIIRNHYKKNKNYAGFEACAKDIISKIDPNFIDIELTPPRKDGGRDGFGKYQISIGGNRETSLKIDFSMEAKCFAPDTVVNVHHMSRLISRIRNKQFGIFITTSYFGKQVYKELSEDKHPILLINASDIAEILRLNSINSENIEEWLNYIDENDFRI